MAVMATTPHSPGGCPADVLRALPVMCGDFDESIGYGAIRPQGSDSWLLFLTRAGAGRVVHRGGSFITGPGEALLCRPGVAQDYRTDATVGRWVFRWAHLRIRPELEPHLHWPEPAPGWMRLVVDDQVERTALWRRLGEAVRWSASRHPRAGELALIAVEEVVLRLSALAPDAPEAGLDPRLARVLDLVAARLDLPWDVARLASESGLSPSRFAHAFSAAFGTTPRRWIEDRRIERAIQLLRATGLSVADVAMRVGFPDPFHFAARVKARTSRTPTAWRARVAPDGGVG